MILATLIPSKLVQWTKEYIQTTHVSDLEAHIHDEDSYVKYPLAYFEETLSAQLEEEVQAEQQKVRDDAIEHLHKGYEQSIHITQEKIDSLQSSIAALGAAITILDSHLNESSAQIDYVRGQIERLQRVRHTHVRRQDRHHHGRSAASQVRVVQNDHVEAIQDPLNELIAKHQALQAEFISVSSELNAKQAQLAQEKSEVSNLECSIADVQTKIDRLQDEGAFNRQVSPQAKADCKKLITAKRETLESNKKKLLQQVKKEAYNSYLETLKQHLQGEKARGTLSECQVELLQLVNGVFKRREQLAAMRRQLQQKKKAHQQARLLIIKEEQTSALALRKLEQSIASLSAQMQSHKNALASTPDAILEASEIVSKAIKNKAHLQTQITQHKDALEGHKRTYQWVFWGCMPLVIVSAVLSVASLVGLDILLAGSALYLAASITIIAAPIVAVATGFTWFLFSHKVSNSEKAFHNAKKRNQRNEQAIVNGEKTIAELRQQQAALPGQIVQKEASLALQNEQRTAAEEAHSETKAQLQELKAQQLAVEQAFQEGIAEVEQRPLEKVASYEASAEVLVHQKSMFAISPAGNRLDGLLEGDHVRDQLC